MRILTLSTLVVFLFACTLFLFACTPREVSTPRLNRLATRIEQTAIADGYEIEIEERRRTYVLTGRVGSEAGKQKMGQIAASEFPRRKIRNDLVVDPSISAAQLTTPLKTLPQPKSIAMLQSEISSIVQKSAQDSGRVEFALTADRQLTLKGDLSSFREVDELLSNVMMVPDIGSISNKIMVNGKPYMEDFQRFQGTMRR